MSKSRFCLVCGRWTLLAAFVACLASGCRTSSLNLRQQFAFTSSFGNLVIDSADDDTGSAEMVRRAGESAVQRLSQWGALKEPVHIQVLPNHQALEEAVRKKGYGWLKAWARYDEIFVQSPRTWTLFGARQKDVDELILHELTHCLMYQASSTQANWTRKRIPLWFREGMASYTANQQDRWMSLEDLKDYSEQHPEQDPLGAPEALYQAQSDVVYAAAHHAFTYLAQEHGEERMRHVLAAMAENLPFEDAFRQVYGFSAAKFVSDFRSVLRGLHSSERLTAPAGSPGY